MQSRSEIGTVSEVLIMAPAIVEPARMTAPLAMRRVVWEPRIREPVIL
jgi:hypothetical protein